MHVYQIDTNEAYRWAGVGYLLGLWLTLIAVAMVALHFKRAPLTRGTRRSQDVELFSDGDDAAPPPQPVYEVRIGVASSSIALREEARAAKEAAHPIKFEPVSLSWSDLRYHVPVEKKDPETGKTTTVQRQLLAGISGFVRAGELVALMGASGAGVRNNCQAQDRGRTAQIQLVSEQLHSLCSDLFLSLTASLSAENDSDGLHCRLENQRHHHWRDSRQRAPAALPGLPPHGRLRTAV